MKTVAGTSTEDTLLLGFGLKQLATDEARADLIGRALHGLIGWLAPAWRGGPWREAASSVWDSCPMGHGVEITELFGIGTKYVISRSNRQKLAVIVRKDGSRELYHLDKDDPEHPKAVIRMDEDEARRLAAVLGGTFFGD